MEGQNKADYLKGLIQQLNMDRTAITVYSDSYLDLPLLNMAGRAIGVGPDHRLKRICLQKGWEIL
jgi:phosphoserine phosphatase